MKKLLAVIVAVAVLPAFAPAAQAQKQLDDIFREVSPTVVVVRAKGRDVGTGGITRFNETGSGVLISASGRVMTAAASPARSCARKSSRPTRPPMSQSCSLSVSQRPCGWRGSVTPTRYGSANRS